MLLTAATLVLAATAASCSKGASIAVCQVLIVFYQIATKVDSVYEVELPAAVKQMLNSFSITFSFGISYTATPLECLGLHGYLSTLLFWMVLPAVFVLVIVVFALGVLCCQRKKCTLRSLVELSMPSILRVLFLVYPLVTNTAFAAFPSHDFSDASYLKVRSRTNHLIASAAQDIMRAMAALALRRT